MEKRLVRIPFTEILFEEAMGDYVKVITPGGAQVSYLSLNLLAELMPKTQFMRIHKSFFINLHHIQFVGGNFLCVAGKELPIGGTYKEALYKKPGHE